MVTGSDGYIGHLLVPLLPAAGYDVVGLDRRFDAGCDLPGAAQPRLRTIVKDGGRAERADLADIDAVLYLAVQRPAR